jgi:TolB-like protein/cytochrome c-type biogenesis protein CcmH/NrfG
LSVENSTLDVERATPKGAVFLSYAREDATPARRIAEALRGFGVEVWFDQSELRGGDQWDAKIRGQIKACALFIPIVSQTTQAREEAYFRLEWKLADDRSHLMAPGKAFIVPVVVDATPEASASVPDSFMRAQWTRLAGGEPSTAFIAQVQRLLEAKSATARSTPPMGTPGQPSATTKKSSPRWTWGALTAVVVGVVVAVSVSRKSAPSSASSESALPATHSSLLATSPSAVVPAKSIAVLPFDNRSESKNDAYFTDGIHDDLLTQISHIRDIKTISRTSVMAYKGTSKNMRTIGEELGVATILEGGVQRAGNQVRINMQLIDAKTDAHLWAETYTREMTAENIFAIQSEITSAIAKALQAVLLPSEQQQLERRATTNLAALEKYFAANALTAELNTEKMDRAVPLYLEAIRLDPAFAPAYAQLAGLYLTQIYYSGLPQNVQAKLAEPLIEQAIRLDPQLSEAYAVRGSLLHFQGDTLGAGAAYTRAIELKPNNDFALIGLARLTFYWLNAKDQGLALILRAQELSPEDASVKRTLCEFLLEMNRYAEARVILKELTRANPNDAYSLALLGGLDCNDGNIVAGVVALRKAYAMDPGSAAIADHMLQVCIDVLGDKEWVTFWLERSAASTRIGKVPLDTRLGLLITQGKLEEADALWKQEWKTDARSNGVVLWEMMLADLQAGRKQAPLARFMETNPELFVSDAKVSDSSQGLFRAKDVAIALTAVGERAKAEQLLTQAEKLTHGHREDIYLFILAKIQLARGDRAAFFQTLRELVGGKYYQAYIYGDPEFAVYRDDPEFQALFGDLPRQRAEMIATLHRMDANGELAPIPPLPSAKKPAIRTVQ